MSSIQPLLSLNLQEQKILTLFKTYMACDEPKQCDSDYSHFPSVKCPSQEMSEKCIGEQKRTSRELLSIWIYITHVSQEILSFCRKKWENHLLLELFFECKQMHGKCIMGQQWGTCTKRLKMQKYRKAKIATLVHNQH